MTVKDIFVTWSQKLKNNPSQFCQNDDFWKKLSKIFVHIKSCYHWVSIKIFVFENAHFWRSIFRIQKSKFVIKTRVNLILGASIDQILVNSKCPKCRFSKCKNISKLKKKIILKDISLLAYFQLWNQTWPKKIRP